MDNIRVLIADDHALIREGLIKILSLEPTISVIGEATDGQEAIVFTRMHPVDIILLDINMPRVNGLTACRVIKEEKPNIGIIALTIHDQEEYLFDLIRTGISGYLLKDISPDQLINTILGVARGESFISPALAAQALAGSHSSLAINSEKSPYGLTEREWEVLNLVAKGESNKIIAQNLYISEKTVKNHLTSIFQKLNVADRTQAAVFAIKTRLIKP